MKSLLILKLELFVSGLYKYDNNKYLILNRIVNKAAVRIELIININKY
jgi:hypothetical protein